MRIAELMAALLKRLGTGGRAFKYADRKGMIWSLNSNLRVSRGAYSKCLSCPTTNR